MISITCTNCRKQLQIDAAFAGGVCRCQYCGTIQTVPARLKQGGGGKLVAQGAASASKTLYKQRPRAEAGGSGNGSGTGLDELAEIVASSGMSSGLSSHSTRSARPGLAAPAPAEKTIVRAVAIVGGAIVVLLLVILAVILQMLPGSSSGPIATGPAPATAAPIQTTPANFPPADAPPPAAAPAPVVEAPVGGPAFCDVPLDDAKTVIYVIDRGHGSSDSFGYVRAAAIRSIRTLGPDRNFQLMFWDNGDPTGMYPAMPRPASSYEIAGVERKTRDLTAHGESDARGMLAVAMQHKPEAIVLVTGKAWNLGPDFAAMVDQLRAEAGADKTRVHTFAIGTPSDEKVLPAIARRTGGQYRRYGVTDLEAFAE